MTFLVLLLVPLIEKFTGLRRTAQRDGWWLDLRRRHERAQSPWLSLLWMVLLPLVLVGLLLEVLEPRFYGWLALPTHLLILLFSLGRDNPWARLGAFREAWRRGDGEAANLAAQRDLSVEAASGSELFERVQAQLLWQTYQGFFAVIFWYLLLGPLAALGYRLLDLSERHAQTPEMRSRAGRLRHVLDWLPVRLLAASFAFVGNFVVVRRILSPLLLGGEVSAPTLLARVGIASVAAGTGAPGEASIARLDSLRALLVRAVVLWYVALALWVILR